MAPETAEAQGLSAELKTPCIFQVVKGRKAKKGEWAMVDASTSVTDVVTRLRQNSPPNVVDGITWIEEAWEHELSGKVLISLVKNEMLKE